MQQGPQFVTAAAAEIAGRWLHSRGWNFYAGRTECLSIFLGLIQESYLKMDRSGITFIVLMHVRPQVGW